MTLSTAIHTALSGLQVTQAGLSVVANNVANVQTPDYVRKTLEQIEAVTGTGVGVRVAAINRQLNELLQMQVRTEASGAGYANTLAQLYGQLQNIYGSPGSPLGLDALFNNFAGALQSLIASPSSAATQTNVINAARVLAQQLNTMSANIQLLRSAAEQGIAADVAVINNALAQIAEINRKVPIGSTMDATAVALMDQRDSYISQLTKLMSIKVVNGDNNQVSIFTGNGIQLVGLDAVQLAFDTHGTLTPNAVWSPDPALRGVGTITLSAAGGTPIDLIANGVFTSGEIAAYLQMRDQVLTQAQSQLDEFAARLSQALSDLTTAGTAVTAGPQSGFDLDVGSLLAGNTIQFTYTDAGSVQHEITIVRVDDPSVLPLANTATANPNDQVIGVDFSGGMASVVAQLAAALGATGLDFSNPGGTTLRILNDVGGTISVDAASTTRTVNSLTSGNLQLPMFVDGSNAFSGAITTAGLQTTGFASRISVNSALISDPSRLIVYQTAPPTAAGDPARPTFLFDQIANAAHTFSPASGIGGVASPFTGTLSSFLGQVITVQGQAAENAKNLQQGQQVVFNALEQRLNQESGVNIDTEMSNLLTLQSAYGANARVLTAIKEMFDILLRM